MAKPRVGRVSAAASATERLTARTSDVSKPVRARTPGGTEWAGASLSVQVAGQSGYEALLALVRLIARQAASEAARSGSSNPAAIGSPLPPRL
jgi:hypothetical protein